ncbi:hypothetical protein [Aquimarina sp. MMG016]|uniref:hypothetical protein n=1 Tax=Aquimarina sp. MMG016 TaxID=2822690 RepID=UPI001B3A1E4D|nr:hypothetical protein [Aquimarina sp. MMG016]MBQ4821264.1 hypothetical protein [Aquimarina sp. MMG016]
MTKLLHYTSLLLMFFGSTVLYSQSNSVSDENNTSYSLDLHIDHKEHHVSHKKVFSYNFFNVTNTHFLLHDDQEHAHKLTEMDIISSDEGFDFNCSGGFCMNKSHYHKRGLTPKKQLFGYFMSIAC